MAEKEKVFREKSLERLNSTDKLDDYLKVTRPSLWLILGAIIALLVGVVFWGTYGTIESTATTAIIIKDNTYTIVMDKNVYDKLQSDSFFRIDDTEIAYNENTAINVVEYSQLDNKTIYYSDVTENDTIVSISGNISGFDNGVYSCTVVFEQIPPIKFVIN